MDKNIFIIPECENCKNLIYDVHFTIDNELSEWSKDKISGIIRRISPEKCPHCGNLFTAIEVTDNKVVMKGRIDRNYHDYSGRL